MRQQFDVFLSYQSDDRPWVAGLKSALESRGLRVWFDKDQILPGDQYVDALERAIPCCQAVAIVISRNALASSWVRDEYQRALALSNSSHQTLRLIPILLEVTELPGFLANREYVDFTNMAGFDDAVEHLIWGIRGARSEAGGHRSGLTISNSETRSVTVDEIVYLQRVLRREQASVRNICFVWAGALLAGLILSVLVGISKVLQTETRIMLVVGLPLVTFLTAWGATAKDWGSCREHLKRLACLKDGLEMCREVRDPGCGRLRAKFWRMVEREADSEAL